MFTSRSSTSFQNSYDLRPLKSMINFIDISPEDEKKPLKNKFVSVKSVYKFTAEKQLAITNFLFSSIMDTNKIPYPEQS